MDTEAPRTVRLGGGFRQQRWNNGFKVLRMERKVRGKVDLINVVLRGLSLPSWDLVLPSL